MPFKLRVHEGNRTGLVALCDVCGKPVRGDLGNILWPQVPDEPVGETIDFRIACKGRCTVVIEKRLGPQHAQELGVELVHLLNGYHPPYL